jgi:hypothetical protein
MSARFDPRPEVFSLLGTAVFLNVLLRSDQTPALLWVLSLVQVVWVNNHALFVRGRSSSRPSSSIARGDPPEAPQPRSSGPIPPARPRRT